MTVSLKPLLTGKLSNRTGGKGMKAVLAVVTLQPTVEALHPNAKWLDMKTIKAVIVQPGATVGSFLVAVNLVGPGSVNNYASFEFRRLKMTYSANKGTMAISKAAMSGTMTKTMLILGE
jgi:hypothetical protein